MQLTVSSDYGFNKTAGIRNQYYAKLDGEDLLVQKGIAGLSTKIHF